MSQASESHASVLQERFGPDVLCDVVSVHADPAQLWPEEQTAVADAVAARRREFAAGRVCAHRLLSRLGFDPAPLLPATDRTPLWPSGAIGSIAHDGLMCAVAVARSGRLASLGLDVEPDEPLEDDLWSTVCTASELAWISSCPRESRGRTARVVFSAKECAYKCTYPLTRTVLEFQDVEITLGASAGSFRAQVLCPARVSVAPFTLEGFFVLCGGSIVTGAALLSTRLPAGSALRTGMPSHARARRDCSSGQRRQRP